VSDTKSEKSSGKKEVTSRIASLWKKVEDSKKKVPKEKDNKVWISKGKVIPESERALIRPDEKQRELINKFQADQKAKTVAAEQPPPPSSDASLKPRSKSRLSIRLSKFSLTANSSKKDLPSQLSRAPASPMTSTPIVPHLSNGDTVNGNWATPVAAASASLSSLPARQNLANDPSWKNRQEADPRSEESSESMSTGTDSEPNCDAKAKRMSRLGTFLNPTAEEEEKLNDDTLKSTKRSPSALVTPYNYNPPECDVVRATLKTSKIATAVRRNDSYVSSMGRIRDQKSAAKRDDVTAEDLADVSHTSSVVVTLV
jgi:hypothetical protein